MILGNGLLAQAFKRIHPDLPPDVVVIARGVSDSLETQDHAYEREWKSLQDLVSTAPQTARFVYFSTSRLDSPLSPEDRRYFHEKLAMEQWLTAQCGEQALIVRLPHIVGQGGHPNIAFNYLWRSVCADAPFVVYAGGQRRELLDVMEVAPAVCAHLNAQRHGLLRLRGVSFEVTDIVRAMQHHFDRLRGLDPACEAGIHPYLDELLKRYGLINNATH